MFDFRHTKLWQMLTGGVISATVVTVAQFVATGHPDILGVAGSAAGVAIMLVIRKVQRAREA